MIALNLAMSSALFHGGLLLKQGSCACIANSFNDGGSIHDLFGQ
ncbi:hypothetical protein [Mycetohabitans sp. B8]|nr:hypothetical protein [Mycetohabitans sp. B8]